MFAGSPLGTPSPRLKLAKNAIGDHTPTQSGVPGPKGPGDAFPKQRIMPTIKKPRYQGCFYVAGLEKRRGALRQSIRLYFSHRYIIHHKTADRWLAGNVLKNHLQFVKT
ncbi:hypothetical protein APED_02610 [Acanthopleuribacter pedis]